MLTFKEEMLKMDIELDEKLIDQSKEITIEMLENDQTEYLEQEQSFRRWLQEDKSQKKAELLDIKD